MWQKFPSTDLLMDNAVINGRSGNVIRREVPLLQVDPQGIGNHRHRSILGIHRSGYPPVR